MTAPLDGRVVEVSVVTLGSPLVADVAAGATSLTVEDFADFNDSGGGTLQLTNPDTGDTEVVAYTSGDDDTGVLVLATPTVHAYLTDSFVEVYPAAYEKVAQVVIDGEDDAMPARVQFADYDRLPEGVRELSEQESVVVAMDSAGEWYVAAVVGQQPQVDGTYLDPTTVPVAVPAAPPAVSPTLAVYGLANGVILYADATQVDAGTEIAYHASLTSGFTPGPSTLLPESPTGNLIYVATKMPDGSDFPLETEVYFRSVASNVQGSAAASAEIVGQNSGTAVAILAADVVAAQTGIIEKVFTDRLTVGVGYLDAVEGWVLPQPGGSATRFTVDGTTPSQIAGYVIVDGGTILDNLNAYGLTQVFGTFRLANGISDPAIEAALSRKWDSIDTDLTSGDFPSIWRGLCQSISNANELITVGSFFTGTARAIHKTTGVENAFVLPTFSDFQPFGGICAIGAHYYMLGQRSSDSTWRVWKYDSSFAYVDDWPVASSFANQPAIGTDGTKVLIAWVASNDSLRLRQYGTAGALDSDDTLLSSGTVTANRALGGVYRGSADFGATRTVIASNNGDVWVFNSSLTRVAADEFERAGGSALRGLHWDGTRFRHIDGNARLWNYATGHVQTSTIWGGYTWFDGDTSSGSSTHETKVSPAQSFSWPARSRLVVTGKPAPEAGVTDPTKLDKANLVRIYVGASSTTMRLQAGGGTLDALPLGENELDLESPNTGSALAPTSSNFSGAAVTPGSFESAKINGTDSNPVAQIKGDGTGRLLKLMQAGVRASGALTAGVDKTLAVTLLEPFPSANYSVAPTVDNSAGNPGNFHVLATNHTTTGFDLIIRRDSGTAGVDVRWIAVLHTQ